MKYEKGTLVFIKDDKQLEYMLAAVKEAVLDKRDVCIKTGVGIPFAQLDIGYKKGGNNGADES